MAILALNINKKQLIGSTCINSFKLLQYVDLKRKLF